MTHSKMKILPSSEWKLWPSNSKNYNNKKNSTRGHLHRKLACKNERRCGQRRPSSSHSQPSSWSQQFDSFFIYLRTAHLGLSQDWDQNRAKATCSWVYDTKWWKCGLVLGLGTMVLVLSWTWEHVNLALTDTYLSLDSNSTSLWSLSWLRLKQFILSP